MRRFEMCCPVKNPLFQNQICRCIFMALLLAVISFPANAEKMNGNVSGGSQKEIIRQVLTGAGAQYGWIPGRCSDYTRNGETFSYCTSFRPGRDSVELMVPVPDCQRHKDKDLFFDEYLLLTVEIYPSKSAAEDRMEQIRRNAASFDNVRIIMFHGHQAVDDPGGMWGSIIRNAGISWQTDSFVFEVTGPPGCISYLSVAGSIYASAVNHGLITGKGVSVQDSDGDGVPDTEDKCPDTAAGTTVDADGCTRMDIHATVYPDHFSVPGETARISARLVDGNGKGMSGKKVTLKGMTGVETGVTDASGAVHFTVTHSDEKRAAYDYMLSAEGITRKLTIPVFQCKAVFEKNPVTGKPYAGVVADGKTFMEIRIDTAKTEAGFLIVKQPELGRIDCTGAGSPCKKISVSGSPVILKYRPPAYLKKTDLTGQVPLTAEAELVTAGAVGSGAFYLNGGRAPWAARVPLNFVFEDTKGKKHPFAADVLVVRPPVMLVHGFTGDRTTWGKLQTWLGGERFDGVIDEYYAGDQDIHDQSRALARNIARELGRYRAFGLKGSKVDVAGHSMGGLIARNYIRGPFHFNGDIRKLIMVGTPNHGAGFTDAVIGRIGSEWLNKHQRASEQLYARSAFMKNLNKGEAAGRHLCRGVQYGNIYGIPDDWVVNMSSAFLNGVRYKTTGHVAHSPAIPVPAVAITESDTVWRWIATWLVQDIPRDSLRTVHVNIAAGRGNVFRRTFRMESGKVEYQRSDVTNFPREVRPWEDIGTGPGAKALLHLDIRGHQWGSIHLDENSLIELGFLSPQSVTVRVRRGSARFVSLNRKDGGHFTAVVGPETAGRWHTFHPDARVIGLDTDFVVTVNHENVARVGILEGRARVDSCIDLPDNSGMVVRAGQAVEISGNGRITSSAVPQNHWWEDKFYADNHSRPQEPSADTFRSVIKPVADAYVYAYDYRNWNRSNRGKYDQLVAGWHPDGGESRAYIRFDLSGIDPSEVGRAVLRLYHFQTSGGNNVDIGIYRVTGPWNEGTGTYHSGSTEKTAATGEISWVRQPPVAARPVISFNPGRGSGDRVEVDITPLVEKWLSGTPNHGLVIRPVGHLTRSTPASVYHFASRERKADADKPVGTGKAPMLILSGNPDVKNALTPPPQPAKTTFSCADRDNEEKGCCCFMGAHTYRFDSRYVTNVLARFDTGKGFNCRSTVNFDVDRGNGWETVKTVQANSSMEGSEVAPTDVPVPVNGAIKGFRISDGCVCCIDSSEITLDADLSGDMNTGRRLNVWAVNGAGLIFRWNGRSWIHVDGHAEDIGAGGHGTVWIIGGKPVHGGYEIYHLVDARFVKVPGAAVRVDAGPRGIPWVVNSFGDIYRLQDNVWQHLPEKAVDIGVGSDGSVWVIGANKVNGGYGIYHWNGGGWENIPGGAVRIDVGPDGRPWVVNGYDQIFHWTGSDWKLMPGKARDIGVGSDGSVWVTGTDTADGGHGIYRWNEKAWKWIRMPGGATAISIGSDRYMEEPPHTSGDLLVSGTYRVSQGQWKSTWRLSVINGQITGTSEWSCCPGRRIDPIRGRISGDSVVMERDCSGQGFDGTCRQTFRGQVKNGRIQGTCTGTGLGAGSTWVMYLDNQS